MPRIRRYLTYANVMSTIAVFLVLGGGTAVALSGSNTVFSDDIVDGQVRSSDLASSAGKTYSNRFIVPYGTNSGTIISVPGFGRLELTFCGAPAGTKASWVNTSSEFEEVSKGQNDEVGVGPGQHTDQNETATRNLVVGRGTGSNAAIAYIVVRAAAPYLGSTRCAFMAQATAQAP